MRLHEDLSIGLEIQNWGDNLMKNSLKPKKNGRGKNGGKALVGICITVVYGVPGRSQPGFFVVVVFMVNRIQSEKTNKSKILSHM